MKKRMLALHISALIACLMMTAPVSAEEIDIGNSYIGNGTAPVSLDDALYAHQEYDAVSAGRGHFLTEEQRVRADVNHDGAVDLYDVRMIMSYYTYTVLSQLFSQEDVPIASALENETFGASLEPVVYGKGFVELSKCYISGSLYVTPDDAIYALTEMNYETAELGQFLDNMMHERADVNQDQKVDLDDAYIFLTYYNLADVAEYFDQEETPLLKALEENPDIFGKNSQKQP